VTWIEWVLVAGIVLTCYPTWATVHELSHVLAARIAGPLLSCTIRIYPHRGPDGWTYAGSVWTWKRVPRLPTIGLVFLAPRAADVLACVALPLGALLPYPWQKAAWAVLWGAGLVDLAVGSVGWGKASDLRRAATALGIPAWLLRGLGFGALASSVLVWLLRLLGLAP
jgi:hypothetical protein